MKGYKRCIGVKNGRKKQRLRKELIEMFPEYDVAGRIKKSKRLKNHKLWTDNPYKGVKK